MTAKAKLYKVLSASLTIEQIKNLLEGVEITQKSPYSDSFYSEGEISWGSKPDGSYRISDHWNFYSRGDIHCETSNKVEDGDWALGVYDAQTGKYTILKSFKKDFSAYYKKFEERRKRKETKITWRQGRILEIAEQLRLKRKAEQRAAKIKRGTLWVECNVNVWAVGRRPKFMGTEDLVGKLVWESKTGNSFVLEFENGKRREIRKYNSYKELKRKPRAKKYKAVA